MVATGQTHSVLEFVEAVFAAVDLTPEKYVKHDPSFERPNEPQGLVGSSAKISRTLGWESRIPFPELVREMVEAELAAISDSTARAQLAL